MSKTRKIRKVRAAKTERKSEYIAAKKVEHPFSLRNYGIFGIGLSLLIIGFYLLAQPASDPTKLTADGFLSLNVAPVFLIVTYVVIIPIGIILRKSKRSSVKE